MHELCDESVDLIITSPPYFNIKSYSQDMESSVQDKKRKQTLAKRMVGIHKAYLGYTLGESVR